MSSLYRLLLLSMMLFAACSSRPDREEGGAADEESGARQAWELRRLRDPATGRIPEGIDRAERQYAAALDMRDDGRALAAASIWPTDGSLSSPVGGRTRAFGVDARGGDTMLAGGVTGGMWRSSDKGATWTRTTAPDSFPASSCLVQDLRPGHEDTWYAGTGELLGGSAAAPGAYYLGDGLFKSTDNGRSWSRLPSTSTRTPHSFDKVSDFVWRVAVDPSNTAASEVYAATYGGISRSTNGGTTWANVRLSSNPYSPYTDVAVDDSGVVYAALSRGGALHGIWRSATGSTWTRITPGDWPTSVNRVVLGLAPSNRNILYLLAETPDTGHLGHDFLGTPVWASLWRYDASVADSAQRWTNLSANLPSFGGSFGDFNPQSGYNLHIEVDSRNEDVVYIGGTNLYRSSNGFRSPDSTRWIGGYTAVQIDSLPVQAYEYPLHHPDQHLLLFAPNNPDRIYTASDGGLHTTDLSSWKLNSSDTVRWQPLNNGYTTGQFYTVAFQKFGGLVAGGLQDNGTWMRRFASSDTLWQNMGSGDGSYCAFASDGSAHDLYVSKQQGRIYRLVLENGDSVAAWTRVDPLGPVRDDYDFINPFVVDPAGTHMYLPIGRALWRNSDLRSIPLGSTAPAVAGWQKLDSVADPRGGVFSTVALRQTKINTESGALWLGTDSGSVLRVDDPTSATPTVRVLTGAAMPRGANVSCIWIDPVDTNRVVVVFSNYSVLSLWLTLDNGVTWESIGGNLEQSANGSGNGPSCRWFESIGALGSPREFVVATSTGVYTTDALQGANTIWTRVDLGGVRDVPVDMIVDNGFNVAVATHGNGLYLASYASLGVDRERTQAARGSVRITPNPVRERAGVEIDLPGTLEREALIELSDARGEAVLRRSIPLSAGRATLDLDLRSVPGLPAAGLYYLRVRAGEQTATTPVRIER